MRDKVEILRELIERDAASSWLERYFGEPTGDGEGWTGRWFERFDGGGDRPEVANTFTSADIASLALLSVGPRVGRPVLELLGYGTRSPASWSALLCQIPTDVCLSDPAGPECLRQGSPAHQLWTELKRVHDIREVTAGSSSRGSAPI